MPTISIRAHGVSATRNQTLVNPETGEIVKLTALTPPERTNTKGWTPNVARRNEQRLQQIDFVPWMVEAVAPIHETSRHAALLLDSGVSGIG